ncbi:MAG: type II secretion system protein GspM [Parvibaculales bacterium]
MNVVTNIASAIRGHAERLWRRMTRREQLALVMMSIAICLFIIQFALLRPLAAYQQTTARALDAASDKMARIEALLVQLEAGVPQKADSDKPPRVRIVEAARTEGIVVERIEPLNPGFRVSVNNVSATALFGWLGRVENNQGMPIKAVSIRKSVQQTRLDADIGFGGGL